MKVIEDHPKMLVLEARPWVMGAIVIVLTLVFVSVGLGAFLEGELMMGLFIIAMGIGMGLGVLWAFVRRTMIIFDRLAGVMILREASLSGQTEKTVKLAEIRAAEVETSHGRKGGATHRPVLVMKRPRGGGRMPLQSHFVSGGGAQRVALAINNWLQIETREGDTPREV